MADNILGGHGSRRFGGRRLGTYKAIVTDQKQDYALVVTHLPLAQQQYQWLAISVADRVQLPVQDTSGASNMAGNAPRLVRRQQELKPVKLLIRDLEVVIKYNKLPTFGCLNHTHRNLSMGSETRSQIVNHSTVRSLTVMTALIMAMTMNPISRPISRIRAGSIMVTNRRVAASTSSA